MTKLNPSPDQMPKNQFVAVFGGIYEHSQWVAEDIFDAGIGPEDADPLHLASRMTAIVEASGRDRRMALLQAHPELAGKLAIGGVLTTESTAEQAGAGLENCSPDEFNAFRDLNHRYRDKFGHPFIIAVRGLDRADILSAFRQRIKNNPDAEFATALAEVHKIARLRLVQLASV